VSVIRGSTVLTFGSFIGQKSNEPPTETATGNKTDLILGIGNH
jgi:hypothetical protein